MRVKEGIVMVNKGEERYFGQTSCEAARSTGPRPGASRRAGARRERVARQKMTMLGFLRIWAAHVICHVTRVERAKFCLELVRKNMADRRTTASASRYQKSKIPVLSSSNKRVLHYVKGKRLEVEQLKSEIKVMKVELNSKCISTLSSRKTDSQQQRSSTQQSPSQLVEKQAEKPYFANSIRTTSRFGRF